MPQGGGVEFGTAVGLGEEDVGELGFFLLEKMDALFDGVFAQKLVYEDGFVLADAIGTVGRLRFGGGVPPGIVVDDGIGGSEIESGAAGFEGNEEEWDPAVLELLDQGTAVLAASCENQVGDALLLEVALDDGEHAGELGEE